MKHGKRTCANEVRASRVPRGSTSCTSCGLAHRGILCHQGQAGATRGLVHAHAVTVLSHQRNIARLVCLLVACSGDTRVLNPLGLQLTTGPNRPRRRSMRSLGALTGY